MPEARDLQFSDSDSDEDGDDFNGSESDTSEAQLVKSMKKKAALRRDTSRQICKGHFYLALSVGVWIAIFGLPMYSISLSYWVFGQRGSALAEVEKALNLGENLSAHSFMRQAIRSQNLSCADWDYGRMVSSGEDSNVLLRWNETRDGPWVLDSATSAWCGILPSAYLSYWPNIAQLVVFTVYTSTGTTINLAVQGVVGTYMATLNMHILQWLFPDGARADPCVTNTAGKDMYLVLSFSSFAGWGLVTATTEAEAWWKYNSINLYGLKGRAFYSPDGKMNRWANWFMPGYEQKFEEKYKEVTEQTCVPGELVYRDPNYTRVGLPLCWLNVSVILLMFLMSKSAKNTIMFGMSWHLYFMMNFMNPSLGVPRGDTPTPWFITDYFVVGITTVVGVLVAVVATLTTPPGIRTGNSARLEDDLSTITLIITTVWTDAVDYFTGDSRSAKRYQIETEIDSIDFQRSQAQAHIDGAWWETLDFGKTGRKRRLMSKFHAVAMDISESLFVVKGAVLAETFGGEHNAFMKLVGKPARELCEATTKLMTVCSLACTDGQIDDEEVERIAESAKSVKDCRVALVKAFQDSDPELSADLAEEELFLFALSMWSRKMADTADALIVMHEDGSVHDRVGLRRAVWQSVLATWSPSRMFTQSHVQFALRNWLSIMTVFVMGYFFRTGIFDRYSSVMPVTLSLLLVNDGAHHVEYEKNLHRLLGVTLGKSLPIILVSGLIASMDCWSIERCLTQALVITAFVASFVFVYFNSDVWNYVGCLVAGFGVYQLNTACNLGAEENSIFQAKYKELGAVIVAITVQALIQEALSRRSPRDHLDEALRALNNSMREAFDAFFAADVNSLQMHTKDAQQHFANVKVLAPECDPKLQVIRGAKAPFKVKFAADTIKFLEMTIAEAVLVLVAAKDWVASKPLMAEEEVDGSPHETSAGILEILRDRQAMAGVKHQLMESISLVLTVLPDMLADTSDVLKHDKLRQPEEVRVAMVLEGADALYQELARASRSFRYDKEELTNDVRVRLAIVVRALENVAKYFGKIEELCIKEANDAHSRHR